MSWDSILRSKIENYILFQETLISSIYTVFLGNLIISIKAQMHVNFDLAVQNQIYNCICTEMILVQHNSLQYYLQQRDWQ